MNQIIKSKNPMTISSILLIATIAITSTEAVHLNIEPDVFGPEGEDYMNNNTNIDMDLIGIDILKKGHHSKKKKCENGALAKFSWTGELEDGRVVSDSL
jgi:hypothetical protein